VTSPRERPLNLFVMPTLYRAFGETREPSREIE
jgi:hypothetical protein